MKHDVVVVGSCNIDQIVYAWRLPKPGETIHGIKYEVDFGGKGANQCVAAAKLGAETVMIAKVGDDDNGRNYIANLRCLGINVENVSVTKTASTGVAPITVAHDGTNSIVIVPGANMLLSPEDVDNAAGVIKMAKVMVCQLEIDMETSLYSLKLAKKSGILTIFNPAPAVPNLHKEFYEYSDVICPNETEASLLTGVHVVDVKSAFIAAKKLVSKGCKTCVITLGENGCVVATAGGQPQHIPGEEVNAVDTTGAGDAFIGALAYFLCHFPNLKLEDILARACSAAAVSVTSSGTQKSFPTGDDLPTKLFE